MATSAVPAANQTSSSSPEHSDQSYTLVKLSHYTNNHIIDINRATAFATNRTPQQEGRIAPWLLTEEECKEAMLPMTILPPTQTSPYTQIKLGEKIIRRVKVTAEIAKNWTLWKEFVHDPTTSMSSYERFEARFKYAAGMRVDRENFLRAVLGLQLTVYEPSGVREKAVYRMKKVVNKGFSMGRLVGEIHESKMNAETRKGMGKFFLLWTGVL